MNIEIAGTGRSMPARIIKNDELVKMIDSSDEWIRSRTGIAQRYVVTEETALSLAADAGRKALEDAGIRAEELDGVIVSTLSAEQCAPCIACGVQAAIGAFHAVCFDVNAACTGFITACQIAAGQMNMGAMKKVLVIGTESLSHLIDWSDRSTCVLFGDGAGAAVLTYEGKPGELANLCVLHADGSKGNVLACGQHTGGHVVMDGREIYRFAVKNVPEVVEEILAQRGEKAEEIDYFILHQANQRIISAIAKRLKQDISKFPMDMMEYGNMSSASIPVLLDELNRQGKLKKGMKLIIAGFGAGLTWGGFYLQW